MADQQSQDSPRPWVGVGESAEFEDCLIGNRAGLEQLRDAISIALSKGDSGLLVNPCSISKVVVLDESTNPETSPKPKSWKDALALVGCALVIFPIGLLVVLGFMSLLKR
jgi:hypothetical protein